MTFDITMSGLVRKACLVAGGHTTDTPCLITYSSVVSRDSLKPFQVTCCVAHYSTTVGLSLLFRVFHGCG